MSKYFLIGVARAYAYDSNNNEIFTSKTQLDDSIEIGTSSAEIRGDYGNTLLYVFNHTGKFNVTLTESQFNLGMIAANVGSVITTGTSVWSEETVTLAPTTGTGTVIGTPLLTPDGVTDIYGWVSYIDVNGKTISERVVFSGKNFTLAAAKGQDVCVRFYENNAAAKSVVIPSNIVPSIVRLVLEAQLASDVAGQGVVGKVQIEIPRLKLEGSQAISLKADGYAQTPLKGMALAYTETINAACSNASRYAKITEIFFGGNWYDDVSFIGIVDSNITLAALATETLVVKAVHSDGSVSTPPVADLTFTSSVPGKATVGLHTGLVTGVASGNTVITVAITAKNTIVAYAEVTVS